MSKLIFRLGDDVTDSVPQIFFQRGETCAQQISLTPLMNFMCVGWEEYDPSSSGDDWNLYWKTSRFKKSEYENAGPAQLLNHFKNSSAITKKDTLGMI